MYPDVESRRKKLLGHCYICLRRGHMVRACKVYKECIYCKKKGSHHRSLCPVQFMKFDKNAPAMEVLEGSSSIGAIEEQVIMQTASVVLTNLKDEEVKYNARLLLDCGSQRTYISKFLAEKLKLKAIGKNVLIVHTFGKNKP